MASETLMKNMKILVPLDSSHNSRRTVKAFFALKEKITGSLTLLHVLDHDRISYRGAAPNMGHAILAERARQAAREFLEEQRENFAAEGIKAEILLKEGPSRNTICDTADSGEFDLLIIGRHTEGELRSLIFGQVSNYVIHKVRVPILIL
jgi:nucleotide-binding universal stress UspA family protein